MPTAQDQPPHKLDYEGAKTRYARRRPLNLALAVICFAIGIPISAMGFGVLTAVNGFYDRDLWRSLMSILIGGFFCMIGMRLKSRR